MEASFSAYNYENSIDRITEILNSSDSNFEDKKSIPARTSLTFDNGYYVDASVIFIDIRGSKSLPEKHTRPVLAKIYRTYISETIAVLRGNTCINEVYIEGDGVWAVFNTPYTRDINEVFSTAARVSSIIDILNIKYSKRGYSVLSVGVGIAYGSALYIKAGHKGSGNNEVVWLGKLVGEAAKLCSFGNKAWGDKEMMVSSDFFENLDDDNKKLMEWSSSRSCYHGDIVDVEMNEWVKENG